MAGAAQADDLNQCMSRMMERVDDSVSIGQLRLQCQKQLRDGSFSAAEKRADVISERVRQDKEHVLEPFTLLAHKPNYILVAAYNSSGYDPSLYRQQFDDPSLDVDDTEAQFQISIETPLAIDLFDTFDLYAAYTYRSFWQVYNDDSVAVSASRSTCERTMASLPWPILDHV